MIRKIPLYVLLIIIPTAAASTTLFTYYSSAMEKENKENARLAAQEYIYFLDRFIGETISSLEMLATALPASTSNRNEVGNILQSLHSQDFGFSAFYYTDENAVIIQASHALDYPIDVADRPYVQQAIQFKITTISPLITGRVDGKKAVAFATPVLRPNQETPNLLLAGLRLDYLTQVLSSSHPDYSFEVKDQEGNVFVQTNSKQTNEANEQKLTMQFERANWEVSVYPHPIDTAILYQRTTAGGIIVLFITMFIYVIVKYAMLKRRAELERKQNDAQKLELLGTLAASTAHEIRNPLTGIKGLVTLLSETHTGEKDAMYFSVIQTEIQRINDIVQEFLILGKPTNVVTSVVALQDIVDEVLPIIRSEANLHHIQVVVEMDEHPASIVCSKNHMKQVILNMAKNSLDAMEQEGTLTISVRSLEQEARLRIIDTGAGMSEDVQKRIFDPFFTGKETGTGLGLVVCKRIIDAANGRIAITSKEGSGTTMDVFLPLA